MTKNRLEGFSDGVLAVIITIMVLEMRAPHGADAAALLPILPGSMRTLPFRAATEPGIDVDALRAAGREVSPFRAPNLFFGGVQAVQRDPQTGALTGAGDPRRGGVAIAA